MPSLVIDASAALHIALASDPTPGLDRFQLVAPPLFLSERTSALAAATFRKDVPEGALQDAFDRLETMKVTIIDRGRDHRHEALMLARSLGWAKSYDAEYVALAIKHSCPLLTTDERLMRGAGHLVQMLDPRTFA
jgi:predicted nucleic acid-binding protein